MKIAESDFDRHRCSTPQLIPEFEFSEAVIGGHLNRLLKLPSNRVF